MCMGRGLMALLNFSMTSSPTCRVLAVGEVSVPGGTPTSPPELGDAEGPAPPPQRGLQGSAPLPSPLGPFPSSSSQSTAVGVCTAVRGKAPPSGCLGLRLPSPPHRGAG